MKLIESGFNAYKNIVIPKDASGVQTAECRKAYFAGAAILLESIMKVMSAGDEPTQGDIQAMMSIQKELDDFGQELDREILSKYTPENLGTPWTPPN